MISARLRKARIKLLRRIWLRGYWAKRKDWKYTRPMDYPHGWLWLDVGRWHFEFNFHHRAKGREVNNPAIYDNIP